MTGVRCRGGKGVVRNLNLKPTIFKFIFKTRLRGYYYAASLLRVHVQARKFKTVSWALCYDIIMAIITN